MRADEIIEAVQEALDKSGGSEVTYIHSDPEGGSFAAIVRADTPAWARLYDTSREENNYTAEQSGDQAGYMIPHSHIEPGEF